MICLVHVHTYNAKHKFEIISLISIQKGFALKISLSRNFSFSRQSLPRSIYRWIESESDDCQINEHLSKGDKLNLPTLGTNPSSSALAGRLQKAR